MNKQRYLAELGQLLVFMTAKDRDETLRRYGELFDQAGEEGLQALLERVGSPTRTAIRLSRSYSPGHITDELLPNTDQSWPADGLTLDDGADKKPPTAAARFIAMPLDPPDEEEKKNQKTTVRSMPLWVGIPLFLLAVAVLALPLGAVVLAVLPVLAVPGLCVLVGAWLAFVGGLWCISYIADAIMMFGVAFIVLAVGLLTLWCGFWLDVQIVRGYSAMVRGFKRLFLGRRVSADA